jgi:RNA-directed DNA polymerase
MKTYRQRYRELYSWENLLLAHQRARKRKTQQPAIQAFEQRLALNLGLLKHQLKRCTYRPAPLKRFILRDPKTRAISKSAYRDRIVHHALVNVLQPIFEPRFIYDSYASREGYGTLAAVQRLERFTRRLTRNGRQVSRARNANEVVGYALKCDIKRYFDTVDHDTLLVIIERRVPDEGVLWLTRMILQNHHSRPGKGMPLGNWTSQFLANVYLNELDQYVKHELKAKYYIRYVDDFIILHRSQQQLNEWKSRIDAFLREQLCLELHPEKCRIIPLKKGVPFLGYRVFYHHKLLRQRNVRRIRERLRTLKEAASCGLVQNDYVQNVLRGWSGYAQHANTHKLICKFHKEISER